ncbi:MAG TPA: GntR family transcriptional regulator [Thermoanaerobaculia bacterium]|jgi:GntR family transcriptional regulator|nr:GntR family transcriptional regulator [Thermoanaerobaculia bacterium]
MTAPVQIDPRDPTPIYAQLDRAIRVAIAHGKLKAGDQLPTVRQLAVDLRVNANTVAKVYLALEREGIVETKRGVGTFISGLRPPAIHDAHRERRLKEIVDRLLTDAASIGFSPREISRYLSRRVKEGD